MNLNFKKVFKVLRDCLKKLKRIFSYGNPSQEQKSSVELKSSVGVNLIFCLTFTALPTSVALMKSLKAFVELLLKLLNLKLEKLKNVSVQEVFSFKIDGEFESKILLIASRLIK